ncbi:MAG: hypothetical protein M3072_02775 [Candidatus Dormibacteraeota bacterium]|nr:hypothetical protein [Candidatus Dormibacteraeota bacterium]
MTKLYAHHDESGKVHALISFEESEGSGMSLETKPGHSVSEVRGPQLKHGPEALEQLRALAQNAHVEGSSQPLTLHSGD